MIEGWMTGYSERRIPYGRRRFGHTIVIFLFTRTSQ